MAISSNELARKPAMAKVAQAGNSRCNAVPSIYDVVGIGSTTDILYAWSEKTISAAAGSWSEVFR
jgi:hypothetical protein